MHGNKTEKEASKYDAITWILKNEALNRENGFSLDSCRESRHFIIIISYKKMRAFREDSLW